MAKRGVGDEGGVVGVLLTDGRDVAVDWGLVSAWFADRPRLGSAESVDWVASRMAYPALEWREAPDEASLALWLWGKGSPERFFTLWSSTQKSRAWQSKRKEMGVEISRFKSEDKVAAARVSAEARVKVAEIEGAARVEADRVRREAAAARRAELVAEAREVEDSGLEVVTDEPDDVGSVVDALFGGRAPGQC